MFTREALFKEEKVISPLEENKTLKNSTVSIFWYHLSVIFTFRMLKQEGYHMSKARLHYMLKSWLKNTQKNQK